jgi:ABC-type multidrug transport system fused ATPase/permease subunit
MLSNIDKQKEKRSASKIARSVSESISIVINSNTPKQNVIFFILTAMTALLPMSVPIFSKEITDLAVQLDKSGSQNIITQAVMAVVVYLLVKFAIGAASNLSEIFNERTFGNASDKMLEQALGKSCKIKINYLDSQEVRDKLEFAIYQSPMHIQKEIVASISLLSSSISIIGIAAIVARNSPLIALVIIIGMLPTVFLYSKQTNEQYRISVKQTNKFRFTWYTSFIVGDYRLVKEVRFNNLTSYIYKLWRKAVDELVSERQGLRIKFSIYSIIGNMCQAIALFAALTIVLKDIFEGKATAGIFILIYSSIQGFNSMMIKIAQNIIDISNSAKYIDGWKELMSYEEEEISGFEGKLPEAINVEMSGVHFSYPGSKEETIKGISLKIRQGEKIAIVGENGSGKSTFIALLTGLYKTDSGSISINDTDIHKCLDMARKSMSYSLQDFGKYQFTISENIAVGDISNIDHRDSVYRAAKLADADGFISELEDGYDTEVGALKKQGVNFSGGQWQKIALARALVREEARLMILDEPTAALDPIAEAKLYEKFQKVAGDRTVILVSHRLGATKLADRILVFDAGKIVEEGNHDELMKLNGRYTQMYNAQAQWYA